MTLKWNVYLILFMVGCGYANAQENPYKRALVTTLTADTLKLDTLFIIKGSVKVGSDKQSFAEGTDYLINYSYGYFVPLHIPKGTLLKIEFTCIPLEINRPVRHKSPSLLYKKYDEVKDPFMYNATSDAQPLFDKEGLSMSGNIARGVAVGNNQNLVVNSNLNLQLSGKISDLNVVAVISDENNPIQPEGNTQQIQDFDKVFIQMSKNESVLTVGDFEMKRPDGSYFMNYYKKSRGAQLNTSIPLNKTFQLKVGGEGALSRGRFARNIINCIEGNQGPYRLTGTNGETYIIIISGTEAVYIDGEKMVRGEQNDYVIDYNSGEIIFMPKRVITQYNRVIVEFQYSDRNYARSVFHVNTQLESKNFKLKLNYFTEQDNKNQPFLQNLTDSNKLTLAQVGDNLSQAYTSGVTETKVFSKNKIIYRKTDSLGYTGIYVFTTDAGSDSVFYELQFSYVGEEKGNYILAPNAANGRVFTWVVPVGGQKQGNYEPLIQLITPKRNQLFTVGTEVNLSPTTKVLFEYAHSSYDKNTFSDLDKQDDGGNGVKFSLSNTSSLSRKEGNAWYLQSDVSYEHVDKTFRYVERYRNVEFDRTWNRLLVNQTNTDTGYNEHIISVRTSLSKLKSGSIYYQLGYYDRNRAFTGIQNILGANLRFDKTRLNASTELVSTQNTSSLNPTNNQIQTIHLDVGRELLFLLAGVKYDRERSLFKTNKDSIVYGSYGYDQYSFYLKNLDSGQVSYKMEYSQREDLLPLNSVLLRSTSGRSLTGAVDLRQKNMNRLSANFALRELQIHDTTVTKLNPERTILTRLEYDYGLLRRVITGNTYLQIGSGNELRRDFQFIEVPVGQGIYIWKDFNDDGKQSTNEFVLASFADKNTANYIKIFLPTNTSVRVNSNQLNQTLNITPATVWAGKKDYRKVIAKFSNLSALKLDRKTSDLSASDFFNPFSSVSDSRIISRTTTLRNTLFFNRSNPTYGADFTYQDNRSKTYLTYGFDSRRKAENLLNMRWNFSSSTGIIVAYNFGNRLYTSEFYSENNYSYSYTELKPKFIYQASRSLRISILYSYFNGSTLPAYGNYTGINKETGMELRYSIAKAGALNLKFSTYQVSFNGNISSPLGYDMLNGFVVGQNNLWNLNFQQLIGNNIQITVNYDGRKSDNRQMVHTGKVEARYLF